MSMKDIKNILIAGLIFLTASFPVHAIGNPLVGISVCVVDMQKVLETSIVGKAARSDLDQELKKGQAQIEKMANDVKQQKLDIQKQAMLLSEDARSAKIDKIRQAERDAQQKMQNLQEDMRRKSNKAIEAIVAEANKIVQVLAKKGRYDFVLEKDRRLVVYAQKEIDISDQVIKELDAKKLSF